MPEGITREGIVAPEGLSGCRRSKWGVGVLSGVWECFVTNVQCSLGVLVREKIRHKGDMGPAQNLSLS